MVLKNAQYTEKTVNRTIGVLDLQGDVVEHIDHFMRLGVEVKKVKSPDHLRGLAGLVIPGGESTCLRQLLKLFKLDNAIRQAVSEQRMKLWGTCAGAIIMARVVDGESTGLGLIDITIQRNAFGSQLASFQTEARIPALSEVDLPLTFIRAPKILSAGENVKVLLELDGYIAMAENDSALVTVFHPEMTYNLAFHRYFAVKCGCSPRAAMGDNAYPGARNDADKTWQPTSWTRIARVDDTER